MTFNKVGITTGLLAYSLRKELFSDAIPYRELEVFNYEIYSSDNVNLSAATIQSGIYGEFSSKYSGDINVKVFNVPAEFQFPNDSIRSAKFLVEVEIKRAPSSFSGFSELGTGYYVGLDSGFFQQYSPTLLDFREDFDFDKGENGHPSFNHSVSFGLLSGGKNLATQIISGLFGTDYNIPLGVVAYVNGLTGANPALVQNYYTETYDLIRNSYAFSKKREFLPADSSGLNYNLNHTLSLQEDGNFEINEKCDLKAKISFLQTQQGLGVIYGGAFQRCSDYYNIFKNYGVPNNTPSGSGLFNTPKKYVQNFNRQSLEGGYEVTYTTDPEFANSGIMIQETIDLDVSNKNIVSLSDKYSFVFNKRATNAQTAYNLINTSYNNSPTIINNYYNNCDFYTAAWPVNLIKYDMSWPNNKNQASLSLAYSNNPRNNVTVYGVNFKTLDYTIDNHVPQDIIQEYKVINRPNKLSVLNYAYQTDKGQITINFNAGIGRQTNELLTGFRTDIGPYLYSLYQHGVDLFMGQFFAIVPLNFTYYLSDVKYTFNSDGMLSMNLQYNYTIKKYIM